HERGRAGRGLEQPVHRGGRDAVLGVRIVGPAEAREVDLEQLRLSLRELLRAALYPAQEVLELARRARRVVEPARSEPGLEADHPRTGWHALQPQHETQAALGRTRTRPFVRPGGEP